MGNDATATEVRLLREATETGFNEVKSRLDKQNGTIANHTERLATVESTMVTTKDCEAVRGSRWRMAWSVIGPIVSGVVLYLLLNSLPSGA